MKSRIILVTGGQRSGKSEYAERLALSLSDHPVYIATARIWDDEFRRRVAIHKERRGDRWTNIEEERHLSLYNIYNNVCLIDCITLWAANFFFPDDLENTDLPSVDAVFEEMKSEFDKFTNQPSTFIFVTNEIGWGGTSVNRLQRMFTDLQGKINQYVADKADEVIMLVCGIGVKIK